MSSFLVALAVCWELPCCSAHSGSGYGSDRDTAAQKCTEVMKGKRPEVSLPVSGADSSKGSKASGSHGVVKLEVEPLSNSEQCACCAQKSECSVFPSGDLESLTSIGRPSLFPEIQGFLLHLLLQVEAEVRMARGVNTG